jgi:hypothetical protein
MELETLVKQLAERLPKDDYPVLNSRKHFLTWLEYVLDESVSSMREFSEDNSYLCWSNKKLESCCKVVAFAICRHEKNSDWQLT